MSMEVVTVNQAMPDVGDLADYTFVERGCVSIMADPDGGPSVCIDGWDLLKELIAAEDAAAHASMDAKEAALDEHGYGGKTAVDRSMIVGLEDFIP